jgi:carbamoyl-phosphate synthase large subunit
MAAARKLFNVLFTSAGRRVAIIQAFRKAMSDLGLSGKVLAADTTLTAPAVQLADVGLELPPCGRVEYVPKLLEFVRRHHVGLLVPLGDGDLRSLARHRDQFGSAGCTVMVASQQTIMLCRDKAKLAPLCKRAGLSMVRGMSLKEFQAQPFYPCSVMSVRGPTVGATALIRDGKELIRHMGVFGSHLTIQECAVGQEFAIDMYRCRDGTVRCAVPRQRLVVRGGELEKALTVSDSGLIDAAVKLGSHLGDLWGVFCVRCRREKPGSPPRFIEISPRFAGGADLSVAAGADLPRYLLEEVLRMPISAKLGRFTENLLMLRHDAAVFVKADDPKSLPGYDEAQYD